MVELWNRWRTAEIRPTEKTDPRIVEAFALLDAERLFVEAIERSSDDEWRKIR
jgi:hypothetical protein